MRMEAKHIPQVGPLSLSYEVEEKEEKPRLANVERKFKLIIT
jgi:hypothetical protein